MNHPYKHADILRYMQAIAPEESAEDWDHVGLMVGNPEEALTGVVLSLDCTMEAIQVCLRENANLLITHHPLLFDPIQCVDPRTEKGRLLYPLIQNNITVYSSHTNLDRAPGGVNDVLATRLGLTRQRTLSDHLIGVLGEQVPEKLLSEFALSAQSVLAGAAFFTNTITDKIVRSVFVLGGAFDEDCIPRLREEKVDLVMSGEIHHHHMLELAAYGIAALAMGHDVTERVVLPELASRLRENFPGVGVATEMGLDYNSGVFRASRTIAGTKGSSV